LSLVIALLFTANALFAASPADFRKWIDSPEAYYATAEERTDWQKVATKEQADEFIAEYWSKRGPAFRKEVMTRIEFADAQFALGGTPGSRTVRGRIWLLLGSPSETKALRQQGGPSSSGVDDRQVSAPGGIGGLSRNNIERAALMTTVWLYRSDRLPKELGLSELTINIQSNVARGQETVENPGIVEPYLRRVAEYHSNRGTLAVTARVPGNAAAPAQQGGIVDAPDSPLGPSSDPLWMIDSSPNNTILNGDAYIGPNEQPFYAVNLFIPKNAATLQPWKSVLFVGMIRDAEGRTLINDRAQVDLQESASGARYLDRSFPLAPGRYEAQIVLFSPEGTTILANHRAELNVPPVTEPRLSRLLMTDRATVLENQGATDPFVFLATKYDVRGDRKFRATDRIGYVTVLANPNASPEPALTQRMVFTRDGQPFARTPLEPVPLVRTGPKTWLIGNQFDPETFKPGHYALELQVRDTISGKLYVEKTEFDVMP
jgi:GWxTD domain-containing protein